MSPLAEALARRVAAMRRKRALLAVVADDFELSPDGCCRRYVVHAAVAKRLNVSVSNHLILELQAALDGVDGFHPFKRSGRGWYRGLRMRRPELADLPRPNLGAKRTAEQIEANRRRALEREASRRASRT